MDNTKLLLISSFSMNTFYKYVFTVCGVASQIEMAAGAAAARFPVAARILVVPVAEYNEGNLFGWRKI